MIRSLAHYLQSILSGSASCIGVITGVGAVEAVTLTFDVDGLYRLAFSDCRACGLSVKAATVTAI